MAIKSYKPTSAGRRHQTCSAFDEITTGKPEKSLLVSLKKTGGRNNNGRVTSRHIGGAYSIALLILREINLISRQKLRLLSMTRIEVLALLYSIMWMERNVIFLRLSDLG
jgi:ribosomal protein L2